MNHSGLIYTRTRRIRAAGITRARTSAKRKQKSDKVCRPSETGDISISMKRHTKPPIFRDTSIQAIDMRAHTHRRELVRSAGPTFPATSAIPRTTRAARAVLPHGIRSAEKIPGTLRGTRQQIEKKKKETKLKETPGKTRRRSFSQRSSTFPPQPLFQSDAPHLFALLFEAGGPEVSGQRTKTAQQRSPKRQTSSLSANPTAPKVALIQQLRSTTSCAHPFRPDWISFSGAPHNSRKWLSLPPARFLFHLPARVWCARICEQSRLKKSTTCSASRSRKPPALLFA